jgi:8-oxo-dGTP pyrophosphatase MutT (NUDIX family)
MRKIQKFEVGIKAFVVRGNKLLLLREPSTHEWEIPGGRIDVGEEAIPAKRVLLRELREELGPNCKPIIGSPITAWVRSRTKDFVFLVGYQCRIRGSIRISSEHDQLRWVDRNSWKRLPLAPGYRGALTEFWRYIK